MRCTTFLPLAACLATIVSAGAGWGSDRDILIARIENDFLDGLPAPVRRQNDDEAEEPTEESSTARPEQPSRTGELNTAQPRTTETGTGTAEETGTRTGTAEQTGTRTNDAEETVSIPFDAFPGAISMVSPENAAFTTALYKVGDNVTFAWNYTNLIATPTAIDVIVSCFETQTVTVTQNWTFDAEPTFTWVTNDTNNEIGLLTEIYTLVVKDSDVETTEIAEPGRLNAVQNVFSFGLYTPRPYDDWEDWECVGCNAASPSIGRNALGFAFTMAVITVASFTWFVTGLGIH